MSEPTAHMPGPWTFSVCDDGTFMVHTAGDVICEGMPNKRGADNPLNFALIAAAPDLFEQLQNLIGLAEINPGKLHQYKAAVDDARALIAKLSQPTSPALAKEPV